jgi:hypothetical protein
MFPILMVQIGTATKMQKLVLAVVLVCLALGLRASSFQWNDQLQGDVNLFALTAREFRHSGELRYPIKYEFSDQVPYCEARSVASQHPPLFPFAGGLLARLVDTDATFPILKVLSEFGGALLLLAFAWLAAVAGRPGAFFALALLAASPVMVDFSANGSPYVWSALALFLASEFLRDPCRRGLGSFAAAGALAGLAPMLHGSLLAVPLAFGLGGLLCRPHLSGRKVLVFLASGLAVVAPYAAWSYLNFGTPFYSYSTHVLWTNLGLAQEGIWDGVVTWRWVPGTSWFEVAAPLLTALGSNGRGLPEVWFRDAGPFVILLAIVGVVQAVRGSPASALRRSLPALFYLALVSPLLFRDRFAVPILPLIFLAAGAGLSRLVLSSGRFRQTLASGLVVMTFLWIAAAYVSGAELSRYYGPASSQRLNYPAMLPIAQRFRMLPPGPTLGYSHTLAGGIEGVYHHGHPLIRGRPHGKRSEELSGQVLTKLVDDFGVRYLWADRLSRPELVRLFPDAVEVLRNGAYLVLEIPSHRRSRGGACVSGSSASSPSA